MQFFHTHTVYFAVFNYFILQYNNIALTKLIPHLLTLVDEDKLSFSTAADYIASLTEQEQMILATVMDKLDVIPTRSQLVKIKEKRKTETLTVTVIVALLSE